MNLFIWKKKTNDGDTKNEGQERESERRRKIQKPIQNIAV